jgi:hypothetical protein
VPVYRERVRVPVHWWFLAALAVVALAAVLTVTPVWFLLSACTLVAVALSLALAAYAFTIQVADDGLTAGRARLPWSAIGRVEALDADTARALRGPDADPSAYLAIRGYVATAVRVEVVDAEDPTPYWYVSTRAPAALAAAIERRTA